MIVLDTHVLVWWVNGSELLSLNAKKAIKSTLRKDSEILISTISVWELSMLIITSVLTIIKYDIWLL